MIQKETFGTVSGVVAVECESGKNVNDRRYLTAYLTYDHTGSLPIHTPSQHFYYSNSFALVGFVARLIYVLACLQRLDKAIAYVVNPAMYLQTSLLHCLLDCWDLFCGIDLG